VQVINTLLSTYIWAATIVVLLFLLLIARFYEVKSGERSHFLLFLLPVALLAAAGVRAVQMRGNTLSDPPFESLLFLAGCAVLALGRFLLRLMTGGR